MEKDPCPALDVCVGSVKLPKPVSCALTAVNGSIATHAAIGYNQYQRLLMSPLLRLTAATQEPQRSPGTHSDAARAGRPVDDLQVGIQAGAFLHAVLKMFRTGCVATHHRHESRPVG